MLSIVNRRAWSCISAALKLLVKEDSHACLLQSERMSGAGHEDLAYAALLVRAIARIELMICESENRWNGRNKLAVWNWTMKKKIVSFKFRRRRRDHDRA